MRKISRFASTAALILLPISCGGSKSPTEPGPAARALLNITSMTVTGSRVSNEYRYAIRLTVHNAGEISANINSAIFTLAAGGQSFGQVTVTDAFGNPAVAPGSTVDSRLITLTDDRPGSPYGETLSVSLTYQDAGGGNTAARSISIPALAGTPTPPPPTTQLFTLSGTVRESGSGGLSGAEVEVIYSADDRIKFNTDGAGNYSRSGLRSGSMTVRASRSGYVTQEQQITLSGNQRLDFSLQRGAPPAPPSPPPAAWSYSGTGDSVFDMPRSVSRVRITGQYSAFCQNFVVKIDGRLIVNEILGTCSVAIGTTYDGTHLTGGGVVEVTNASGVRWSFSQVQ